MLGVNCRSSSSYCPSPLQLSSIRALDNGILENVLNVSPRPSSLSNPAIQLDRSLPEQASLHWDPRREVGYDRIKSVPFKGTPRPKSSAELRKEIAELEVEILHLERYVLSLYRTAFEEHLQTLSNISTSHLRSNTESPSPIEANQLHHRLELLPQKDGFVHRDQPSPTYDSSNSDNQSCYSFDKAVSAREQKNSGSRHRSLADHLGASLINNNLYTPDRLSEDIVRCISSIYCKLANGPHANAGLSASPISSLSSSSIFSSKNPCDSWSPNFNDDVTVNGLKEETGSYPAVIEVLKLCLHGDSFNYAALMLQNFRSMVRNLEKIDPSKMKREEKLAFWINIHNALLMHAYLAYGTHNRIKNTSIMKAAYNVGGHCVNAYDIQSSILGIRPHHSAPLLQALFSPGRKFKTPNIKHVYALEYPEPLVHFALCSGAYSDPVVQVYTAKNIFKDLKHAKEAFIQANVYIHKESKIFLPKILCYYAKDMSLDISGILEEISGCLTEAQQKVIKKCMKGRPEKCIHWLPQSSTFRYIICRQEVKERISI